MKEGDLDLFANVCDRDPALLFARFPGSSDNLADLQAVAKLGPDGFSSLNRLEEIPGFDDDLILVAGTVAWALTEGPIVRMVGAGENAGKAFSARRALAFVQPQGVLVLLVESQRTTGAKYLVCVAHLTSGSHAAEVKVTHGATLEPAQELSVIIVCHCHRPSRPGPLPVNGFDVGDERLDWADQCESSVYYMRREVAHGTVGAAARAPGPGRVGVREEIFGVLTSEVGHVSNLTRGNDIAGEPRGGRADVVEPDHVCDTGICGCRHHGTTVLEAGTERFLAEYWLAEREARCGDVVMGLLRRGDHHRLDRRVVHQLAPVGGRAAEPEGPGSFGGTVHSSGAYHLQHRAECGVEHRADR
mmetsp:Transcript_32523/g.79148  ORF Transcript_32523/g.79148 Transcript_32523/m.79148 type:complete len:359 (-) Transcript_32523:27-1103(-)